MATQNEKFRWHMTSANHWASRPSERGYSATIVYVAGTGYTLTVTGAAPPSPSTWKSLKLAKNSFRLFLHTV